MNRGITIIAFGHPYYGRQAHQLAATIKVVEPDMPIALIHNKASLVLLEAYNLSQVFDHIIEAPLEAFMTNGKFTYVKGKTWLYDLSPFEETISIDADAIWLPEKKPSQLFDELKDTDFAMANHEFFNVPDITYGTKIWGRIKPVVETYGFTEGKYYSVSSEVIYFKRTDKNKEFFDTAKNVFENPKTKPDEFAGYIPDEFAFSVAAVITGVYPHASPWHPSFWTGVNPGKIPSLRELNRDYYILSAGGKLNPNWVKNLYNQLVGAAFYRLGLRNPWRLRNKRSFLPERSKI